jgi:hypothetical protein
MSKRAKARADGSNGSMGHDIFFGASVCRRVPSGLAITVSPIKQNHFLVKSYKPMTHLTHRPMKIGAFAMTPNRPSATHRAMGHANRLTTQQDLLHSLDTALRWAAPLLEMAK